MEDGVRFLHVDVQSNFKCTSNLRDVFVWTQTQIKIIWHTHKTLKKW